MSHPEVEEALHNLFARREQVVVIGLTGRTGSGCSTVAELLTRNFESLNPPQPVNSNPTPEQRKYRITHEYAKKHWKPFVSISISNVIQSFILDCKEGELEEFLSSQAKLKEEKVAALIEEWRKTSPAWIQARNTIYDRNAKIEDQEASLKTWRNDLGNFFSTIKTGLGPDATKLLQLVGDNVRKSGTATSNKHLPEMFYTLLNRVTNLIRTIKSVNQLKQSSTLVVLDALRNPFEILYFKERFPSFYAIAITTNNEEREKRLTQTGFNATQISELDKKEYPEKSKPLSGYDSFTSQNIQSCLEKADIHIRNDGTTPPNQQINLNHLSEQLIRYISLMMHPGLVTPTRSERCMQVAFTAKMNSGCISRQVGAAITDEYGSIKAVGWNDVPEGQIPCILRSATDLLNNTDEVAFSDYEYKDKEFRKQLDKSYKRFSIVDTRGRSACFCFKSEYNKLKDNDNQVHTRSLHAEENAFLQLSKYGGEGIKGGSLFTTASPCELCAKKAFQLGMREIVFIDPYPGISMDHILRSGPQKYRPSVQLFQGAIGQAYHRLYEPILPIKDELQAIMQGAKEEHSEPIETAPNKQLF